MWVSWKASLNSSSQLSVPRSYIPQSFGPPTIQELHAFGDASDSGTGYVIYIRSINQAGAVHVAFVSANSRIPAQAAITIPRLELCASADLAISTHEIALTLKIPIANVFLYTDSRIVLGYLTNTSRRFSVYVTRRVNVTLKHFPASHWKYIPTSLNPADIASRPQTTQSLMDSWFHRGPPFLWKKSFNEDILPQEPALDLPETKQELNVMNSSVEKSNSPIAHILTISSSLCKALTLAYPIVSFVMYTVDCVQQRNGISLAPRILSSKNEVLKVLIRDSQKVSVSHLRSQLLTSSKTTLDFTARLSPFLDEEDIIRVGGRLRHADLPATIKHLVLLSDSHPLALLLIRHYHVAVFHQGRTITAAAIHNAGFYIYHCSKAVRKVMSNCVVCRRLRGPFLQQQMSDLPCDRLVESPLFTSTGLDVFGPYEITDGISTRRSSSSRKMWAVIFTCLVSRATHIEPLPMMDTSSFINALRRFFAVRGTCKRLQSDQGSNFVGAFNQGATLSLPDVQKKMADLHIIWEMNPPKASHFGGVWERKIATIKRVIDASLLQLGPRRPSRDELCTFLQEVAAVLNNTPLCPISFQPEDPFPITPAMLLTLKDSPNHAPPEAYTETDRFAYGPRRWRRVQHLSDCFFKRWREEYLRTLTTRQKWLTKERSLQTNDVVLIRDAAIKRNNWKLGRVLKAHVSDDGLVRSVTLRLSNSTILWSDQFRSWFSSILRRLTVM